MEEMKYLKSIKLATELDKKVAFAEVRVGNVAVKGITVWRSPNGKLSVFFPSQRIANYWEDTIELPAETRTDIETEVIAAYRKQKKRRNEKWQPR